MNVTFEKTKKLINELIDKNNEYLDTESKEAILNYIEHDEYEMAFEGLFIELIKLNLLLSSDDERDMAFELAELGVLSIPINILNPIEGTPLGKAQKLTEKEVLSTIAIFRWLIHAIPRRYYLAHSSCLHRNCLCVWLFATGL